MYSNADKIEWTLIFVSEFGRKFGLTMKQAFNYLTRYKGIDFIDRHYDYVHTQSFQSMITDLTMEQVLFSVLNSDTYLSLQNDATHFYHQSPRYVYDFLVKSRINGIVYPTIIKHHDSSI